MSDWIDELAAELRSGAWTVEYRSVARLCEVPIDNPVSGKVETMMTTVPVIEVVFRKAVLGKIVG